MFAYERHLVVAAIIGVIVLAVGIIFIVVRVEGQPARPQYEKSAMNSYPPPSLDGFVLGSEEDADGDADGSKETHIRHYRSANGDGIFNMTTGGVLWAWSYDTHADDDADVTRNYVIRDSDCDGVFDQRYSLSAEFRVPECTKRESVGSKP